MVAIVAEELAVLRFSVSVYERGKSTRKFNYRQKFQISAKNSAESENTGRITLLTLVCKQNDFKKNREFEKSEKKVNDAKKTYHISCVKQIKSPPANPNKTIVEL